MVIYCTTNLINGKKYIGKDEKNCKSYLGSGKIFKKALIKYGKSNFKKEILAFCDTKENLSNLEKLYINIYEADTSGKFYNIAKGGNGGNTSNQSLRKVKIYQFNLDQTLVKEWNSAVDAAISLNIQRTKIVAECKDGGSYKGFLWSRSKIYPQNNIKHKFNKILQYDLEGNFIKEWESLQTITNMLGYNKANIQKVYSNKSKTAYGFKWILKI